MELVGEVLVVPLSSRGRGRVCVYARVRVVLEEVVVVVSDSVQASERQRVCSGVGGREGGCVCEGNTSV